MNATIKITMINAIVPKTAKMPLVTGAMVKNPKKSVNVNAVAAMEPIMPKIKPLNAFPTMLWSL